MWLALCVLRDTSTVLKALLPLTTRYWPGMKRCPSPIARTADTPLDSIADSRTSQSATIADTITIAARRNVLRGDDALNYVESLADYRDTVRRHMVAISP